VHLAFEFKVPPSSLEHESPRMLATMQRYLEWRANEIQKQQKARRR